MPLHLRGSGVAPHTSYPSRGGNSSPRDCANLGEWADEWNIGSNPRFLVLVILPCSMNVIFPPNDSGDGGKLCLGGAGLAPAMDHFSALRARIIGGPNTIGRCIRDPRDPKYYFVGFFIRETHPT